MGETEFVIEPGRQDIVITRVFDAPREVVFKALTDPNLIPSWWGPARYETTVDRADVRPGGQWRYVSREADGTQYGFRGVYHDIVAPDRVVQTFEFEGMPGHVSLDTATLEEVDGKTKYVGVSVFQSVADRDGMAQSGMEEGASEGFDRLAEVIQSLL
ncbi:MAG: SRPBCC family protein [Actinomycetota bacterium]|nr:SRPBCC family protein [Actinomycetota bacterium]